MLRAAKRAAVEAASAANRPVPLIVAVTALTSLDDEALVEIGDRPIDGSPGRSARRPRAERGPGRRRRIAARDRNTARAISRARRSSTPGIRASSAPADDQSRTLSAREALAAGASYLVVGRPIVAAADPRSAAEEIAAQLRLTIYSKPGCHLCDEMKALVHRTIAGRPTIRLDEIDISTRS